MCGYKFFIENNIHNILNPSPFYILLSGGVHISLENNVIRTVNQREAFGEVALLYRCQHFVSTATAVDNCTVLVVDPGPFMTLFRPIFAALVARTTFLHKHILFRSLPLAKLHYIGMLASETACSSGTRISSEDMYLLVRGEIASVDISSLTSIKNKYTYPAAFNQQMFLREFDLTNQKGSASDDKHCRYEATTDCILYAFSIDTFARLRHIARGTGLCKKIRDMARSYLQESTENKRKSQKKTNEILSMLIKPPITKDLNEEFHDAVAVRDRAINIKPYYPANRELDNSQHQSMLQMDIDPYSNEDISKKNQFHQSMEEPAKHDKNIILKRQKKSNAIIDEDLVLNYFDCQRVFQLDFGEYDHIILHDEHGLPSGYVENFQLKGPVGYKRLE